MQEPVVEPPQEEHRLEPGGSGPVLQCVGRFVERADRIRCRRRKVGSEVTVKACGVAVAWAAGEKLGAYPVDRFMVNVGTVIEPPSCRSSRPATARHAVC